MDWGDLKKPGGKDVPEAPDAALAKMCAHVFGRGEGRDLLRHLRAITKDRMVAPDSAESALRWLEGQRYLVHRLESLTAKGLQESANDLRDSLSE
mgnify:CR=1 FL=1